MSRPINDLLTLISNDPDAGARAVAYIYGALDYTGSAPALDRIIGRGVEISAKNQL